MFWRICAVWALLLGTIVIVRPYFSRQLVLASEAERLAMESEAMPIIGEVVDLPSTLATIDGQTIPTLGRAASTFMLVTWAGCPVCRREWNSYPEILQMARESGYTTRMLIAPSQSAEDNQWFLDRLPSDQAVVWDTLQIAVSMLQVRVTPSIVIVSPDSVIENVFHPSGDMWPVTSDGSSPFLVGSGSCGYAIGVEVEAAEVEEDGVREAVPVAKAAAADLHGLDPAVDAFRRSVGGAEDDRVEMPQRCFRIIRAVFRTGSRPQSDAHSSQRCHPDSAQVLLR